MTKTPIFGAGHAPFRRPLRPQRHVGRRGCMLRQVVYSPLSLLAAALRIDKHQQRMSAVHCCDLDRRMSKQTIGAGRLQDALQESAFKAERNKKTQQNRQQDTPSAQRVHAALPSRVSQSVSQWRHFRASSVSLCSTLKLFFHFSFYQQNTNQLELNPV